MVVVVVLVPVSIIGIFLVAIVLSSICFVTDSASTSTYGTDVVVVVVVVLDPVLIIGIFLVAIVVCLLSVLLLIPLPLPPLFLIFLLCFLHRLVLPIWFS